MSSWVQFDLFIALASSVLLNITKDYMYAYWIIIWVVAAIAHYFLEMHSMKLKHDYESYKFLSILEYLRNIEVAIKKKK